MTTPNETLATYADAPCDRNEMAVLGGAFPEWCQPSAAAVVGSASVYGDHYEPRCRRVVVSGGLMNPRCVS